ncbi:MAG: GIY-YIG nuclease family protein [Candidatus Omnitrophica bacterium]|nr:GIY-YIG nuclease family protein [Candidatus Omnitrophota bacterium]
MWYVYILECQDGKLYTGLSEDPQRRFCEHQNSGSHFTSYNPAKSLLYTEKFANKSQAAKREKQIKGWTRRKKIALINGDFELLKKL